MIDDLLNKLASQEKSFLSQEIFSPYLRGGANLSVKLNGVIYKLKTSKFKKDGFGIFKAKNYNSARFVREAEMYEKDEYLGLLPKVDLILVYNVNRWVAYPAHINSFKHRFNMDPKLYSVLCADNVEIMDTVEARFDGSNFWFDSIKFAADVDRIESLRTRLENKNYSITDSALSGLTPEESKAFELAAAFHKQEHVGTLERRLSDELFKYGAKLDKFIERGTNVSVQWRDQSTGGTYTSVLDKYTLNVVTAGICLSGGDKVFDLQSLVGVCRQAETGYGVTHVGDGGINDDEYWRIYGDRSDDY